MRNEKLLNSLPSTPKTGWIPAYLLGEDGSVLFEFLYNPESIEQSYSIKHSEAETALSSVQNQQYGSTSSRVIRLSDLLMESWASGKSLKPLLEKLRVLSTADPTNGVYAPPVVYFAWGSYTSPPCVLTESINWTETAWLGGEPAEVRLSLTLKEVPPSNNTATVATSISTKTIIPTNDEKEAAERLDNAVRTVTNSIASLIDTSGNGLDSNKIVNTAKSIVLNKVTQNKQRQRVTVKAGDSLYSLASRYLGSRNKWRELALYNNIQALDSLTVGGLLSIPTMAELEQIAQALLKSAPDPIASVISEALDLSSIKQPDTGNYSLISWIL